MDDGGNTGGGDNTPAAEGTADYVKENTALKGDFSEDVTLEAGKEYKIEGEVNFLDGTTLTIPAGTTLYGVTGDSFLAINRGAKIIANGTAANPIVFTSAQDIAGQNSGAEQGQWGGLSIFGKASNNKGERTYEAGTQLYGPVNGVADDNDNSGSLRYVIIKHSGYEVEKDKELNGLSLGSVGAGTTIENVAVIGSADDGIEFWGGTVDVKNLYVFNAGDDSIDTDQGYVGTIDNAYVKQVEVDDETGSRGIEADGYNETQVSPSGLMSKVTLKNATLDTIGRAVRLREGTGYVFDNVQVNVQSSSADPAASDYADTVAAIRISDDVTFAQQQIDATGKGLAIKNDAVSSDPVASGLGLYNDDATRSYFRNTVTGSVHEDPRISDQDSGTANPVTGANMGAFEWVSQEQNDIATKLLTGDITSDTTLTADTLWGINGEVNVKNGATLTIEPGTTLYGVTGSSFMAINRGAKIIADGTREEPIVFTSAQDIAGQNTGDEQGQWGGLTLLGYAQNNKGERTYEAGTQLYGPVENGNMGDPNDNSGILRYVVVKYSGYEVEKDKELNGISLASVGSGTVIENVASIGSADDGIEFWGGNVDVNGLYVYNAGDDSLDTDQGYVGTLENVYAEQNVVDDEQGSRVIEADGWKETGTSDPMSKVTLKNAMLKSVGRAIRLREGTGYVFDNVQVNVESSSDAAMEAVRISDQVTFDQAQIETAGSGIAIKNNVNASALYSDVETQNYFQGMANVAEDAELSVPEYDYSWIPE